MKKRLAGLLAIALLATALGLVVGSPSADASDRCDLVIEPSVGRTTEFNPDVPGINRVSGQDLITFQGGSILKAREDAVLVLGFTSLSTALREFYTAVIEWLDFLSSNACAEALPYPGPFTVMPPTPAGPYGWGSLNPTAESSVSASGDAAVADADATPTLAHTGAETNVLGFVGAGLIGFGALSMAIRRRLD